MRRGSTHALAWILASVLYLCLTVLLLFSAVEAFGNDTSGALSKEGVDRDVTLRRLIDDDLVRGEPAAVARLEGAVQSLVRDGHVLALRVRSEAGDVIVAASETATAGSGEPGLRTTGLDAGTTIDGAGWQEELNGSLGAEYTGRYVELHTSFTTAGGTTVLVDSLYPYAFFASSAQSNRDKLWNLVDEGALITIPQLALFGVIGRLTKRHQRERERLLERVISTSDDERRRISAGVHDGAMQDLMGISMTLQHLTTIAPPEIRAPLEAVAADTRVAIRTLRSSLNSIHPVVVPEAGLGAGIREAAAPLRDAGVAVTVDVPDLELTPIQQLLFLRVAREAFRNVHTHARATQVSVTLSCTRDGPQLCIADDGIGFDADTEASARHAGHIGLDLVRSLAEECGATLTVTSHPGAGTVVRVS